MENTLTIARAARQVLESRCKEQLAGMTEEEKTNIAIILIQKLAESDPEIMNLISKDFYSELREGGLEEGIRFAGVQVEDEEGFLLYEITSDGDITDYR